MKNKGFTLIEVLIFTSLISFIFITLSYLTVNSIQNSKIGSHKILAAHYAEELRELLRSYKEANWKTFANQTPLQPKTVCYGPIAGDGSVPTEDCGSDLKCVNQCNTSPYIVGNAPDSVFKRYATTIYDSTTNQVTVAIIVESDEGGRKFSVPLDTLFAQYEGDQAVIPPTPTPSCLAGVPVPASLCNWTIVKTVTISNTTGIVLTNYQVKVVLSNPLSGMKGDFGDVRFADSLGTVELSHWREMPLVTPAIFWVKAPSVPAGSSTIKLVYGKADALSASNGKNAFPIYFDFDDGNSTGWTVYTGSSLGVSGGILTWNTLGVYPGGMFYTGASMTRTQLVDARLNSVTDNFCGLGFLAQDNNNFYINRGVALSRLMMIKNSAVTILGAGGNYINNTFWRYTSYFNGSTVYSSIAGGPTVSGTESSFNSGYVGMASYCGDISGQVQLDWILVREYRSPDPTTTISP